MAESKIQIVIDAQDKASAKLGKLSGALSASFKVIAVAAAAAAAATLAFGVKAVKDFAAAEAAQKQLEHAVLDVTKATRGQLEATMALADQLEKKGVLDGDAIKMGLAQLSTMGLQNESVQALAGSLADYAVNQYGVSASAEQLTQAANGISKAFQGNFRAFVDAGIVLTDAQKSMLQFGTETERVNAINQIFAANLKYTNEVARQTTEGSLAALHVALENISEQVGGALAPALTALINNVILPMIPAVQQLVEKGLNALRDAFQFVKEKVQLLWDKLKEMGIIDELKMAFEALWTVIVTQLWPALQQLFVALEPFLPLLKAIAAMFGVALFAALMIFIGVLTVLVQWISTAVSIISTWVAKITNDLKPAIEFVTNTVTGFTGAIRDTIGVVNSAVSAINSFITAAQKAASLGIGGVVSKVAGAVGNVLGIGKKAGGGPVGGGTPYLVGEQGPEMFVPSGNGRIIPNGSLGAMAGGGGVTINVSGNTFGANLDARDVALSIGDEIMRAFKMQVRV